MQIFVAHCKVPNKYEKRFIEVFVVERVEYKALSLMSFHKFEPKLTSSSV